MITASQPLGRRLIASSYTSLLPTLWSLIDLNKPRPKPQPRSKKSSSASSSASAADSSLLLSDRIFTALIEHALRASSTSSVKGVCTDFLSRMYLISVDSTGFVPETDLDAGDYRIRLGISPDRVQAQAQTQGHRDLNTRRAHSPSQPILNEDSDLDDGGGAGVRVDDDGIQEDGRDARSKKFVEWVLSLPRLLWEIGAKDLAFTERILLFLLRLFQRRRTFLTPQETKELRRRMCPLILVDHPTKGVIPGPLFKDVKFIDKGEEEQGAAMEVDAAPLSSSSLMAKLSMPNPNPNPNPKSKEPISKLRKLVLDVALVSGSRLYGVEGSGGSIDDELSEVVRRARASSRGGL